MDVPITFSISKLPVLDILIQGEKYATELDLGADDSLMMHEQKLSRIKKRKIAPQKWAGINGKIYETNKYIIPTIMIGAFAIKNCKVVEMTAGNYDFGLIQDKSKIIEDVFGSIGRDVLKNVNLYLDFPNKTMSLFYKKGVLKKKGIHLKDFISIPFSLGEQGAIILQVETDFGVQPFFLDTGSTINVIKPEFAQETWNRENKNFEGVGFTKKFIIGGKDFGPTKLYGLKISEKFGKLDGMLGMAFLKDHAVCIDNVEHVLYIK